MKHLFSRSKSFAIIALSLLTGIGVFSGVTVKNSISNNYQTTKAESTTKRVFMTRNDDWGEFKWTSSVTCHYWGGASSGEAG